ncbi:hypothetical protein CASFOL_006068 [Castilleja foliolosa]|uniref:Uncharacterized protein n=1 Tax=Castilleja foliolosa TaxID=1961234 RepID=A0ABD3E5A9_9LAMI
MDKKAGCRLTRWEDNSRSDIQAKQVMKCSNGKSIFLVKSISLMGPEIAINVKKLMWQFIKWDGSNDSWEEHVPERNTGCPSKFLIMCLNTIQDALQQNGADWDRPLFANDWGLEFWNCYVNGNDVLDNNGADSTIEKIAWVTSTAADTISMKEKEGRSFDGPFLLYLVQSQDRSYKVGQVCKFLEVVGIQTLSLHSDALIDHQIHSLKSHEPEFLISTPERLLELLSVKAVDISDVSLMVVDGLEAPFKGSVYLDSIKSIRQFVSGNPQVVVFCDCK